MSLEEIVIPQMGEGLTEVRLLAFHKQPGERIERDEVLYSMETDKATMEVESPVSGVLQSWLSEEGAILAIGAPIATIETEAREGAVSVPPVREDEVAPAVALSAAVGETPARPEAFAEAAAGVGSGARIPPRTRQHARKLGIGEAELVSIPAKSATLLPEDVESWLSARQAQGQVAPQVPPTAPGGEYRDYGLSSAQRLFVYRMRRSAQTVIAGTVRRRLFWGGIRQVVSGLREQEVGFKPTEFQTLAYCVGQAVAEKPKFRSTLLSDETVREYGHVNLGIAVARENGELVTAVVAGADRLSYREFIQAAQASIQRARGGEDQAVSSVQLLLTYLGAYGIEDAVPVLVSPAVGVLFIGSVLEESGGAPRVNLVLSFDHRLVNGVEAAQFLQAIVDKVHDVQQLVS